MQSVLHQRRTGFKAKRRATTLFYCLVAFSCLLQPFLVQPVSAKLDFMTKLKLIGLLALTKKIQLVPVPFPIPIPIHIEGKEEILYVKGPAPIYSYPPGQDYNYAQSNEHQSKGGDSYKSNGGDYSGHASEIVPVATSFRYGDRISANGAQQPSRPVNNQQHQQQNNQARPNRPVRVRQGQQGRISNQYLESTPTNTASPPPQQVEHEYRPATNYEPVIKSEVDVPSRIALIPFKSLDLANIEQLQHQADLQPQIDIQERPQIEIEPMPQPQSRPHQQSQQTQQQTQQPAQQQSQHQAFNGLSENLLNYVREVHNLPGNVRSERAPVPIEKPKLVVSEAPPKAPEISGENLREVKKTPKPTIAAPTQMVRDHNNQNLTPQQLPYVPKYDSIQSVWQTQPIQSSAQQAQAIPYPGGYRAPELKVIRTKYNPKQQQEEQQQWQYQNNHNQMVHQVNNKPQGVDPSQQTQFLYTVSHESAPPAPFFNTHLSNPHYPVVDNFGLAQYQATQNHRTRQPQTRPNISGNFAAAASYAVPKWTSAPVSDSEIRNTFGYRTSKLTEQIQ